MCLQPSAELQKLRVAVGDNTVPVRVNNFLLNHPTIPSGWYSTCQELPGGKTAQRKPALKLEGCDVSFTVFTEGGISASTVFSVTKVLSHFPRTTDL